jgi:hypothetical protein
VGAMLLVNEHGKGVERQTGFASSAFAAGQVKCHLKPEGA